MWTCPDCLSVMPAYQKGDHERHHTAYKNTQPPLDAELNGPNYPTQLQIDCARIAELEMALQVLLPGLILDLRYADLDDDKDAMRARIETVQTALAGSPSRPGNLSTGSALSDATPDRRDEHG
jgi:hypothetical protein